MAGFRNVGEEENEVALIVLVDYKRGLLAVALIQQRAVVGKKFSLMCDLLLSYGPVSCIPRNKARNRPLQGLAECADE